MSIRAADETTEVMLADYLDGRLTPERKREIDLYLERHPKENEVIEHLRAQRQLLGALPREDAPVDVYAAVQSSLERSVLLDSLAEIESPRSGGVRSRPQMLALAACIIASLGLIGVVYLMIAPPLRNGGNNEVAIGGAPANTADKAVATPASPSSSLGAGAAGALRGDGAAVGGRAMSAVPPAALSPADGEPARRPAAENSVRLRSGGAADARLQGDAPAEGLSRDSFTNRDPLAEAEAASPHRKLVIVSSDLSASRSRIEQFLHAGGWAYLSTPVSPADVPSTLVVPGAAAPPSTPGFLAKASDAATQPSLKDTHDLKLEQTPSASALPATPPGAPGAGVILIVRVEADQADALYATLSKLGNDMPELSLGPTTRPTTLPGTFSAKEAGNAVDRQAEESLHNRRAEPNEVKPGEANSPPTSPAEKNLVTQPMVNLIVDLRPPATEPRPSADSARVVVPDGTIRPLTSPNLADKATPSTGAPPAAESTPSAARVPSTNPSTRP